MSCTATSHKGGFHLLSPHFCELKKEIFFLVWCQSKMFLWLQLICLTCQRTQLNIPAEDNQLQPQQQQHTHTQPDSCSIGSLPPPEPPAALTDKSQGLRLPQNRSIQTLKTHSAFLQADDYKLIRTSGCSCCKHTTSERTCWTRTCWNRSTTVHNPNKSKSHSLVKLSVGQHKSQSNYRCGVLQGSILGPIRFMLYTLTLTNYLQSLWMQ